MSDVEVRPAPIQALGILAACPFRAGDRIRRVNVVRGITPAAPLRRPRSWRRTGRASTRSVET